MTTEESYLRIEPESASTSSIRQQMLRTLQASTEHRLGFIEEAIRSRLTAQIKTIREQRGWDYKRFAEAIGKKVSWVYRLEDPNATPPTIPTLLGVAEAFDVGLDVRFRSFSELLDDAVSLTPESFLVPSFEEELSAGSFSHRGRKRKVKTRRRKVKARIEKSSHEDRDRYQGLLLIGANKQQGFRLAS